jgi:hypothetical protein
LITNTGKNIIGKYLLGQAPSYASYIALGTGRRPINNSTAFGDYRDQTEMEFEALRVPITSRGYVVDELGNSQLVFSADIPGDQRYEFTEIGIFSGKSNPAAGILDSRVLYTFGQSENWEYHTKQFSRGIITETGLLNNGQPQSIIDLRDTEGNPVPVFRTNSDNQIFNTRIRLDRYERPRFLDRAIVIAGDMSYIDSDGDVLFVKPEDTEYYGTHIHLAGISPNFNRNSALDELRLSFSLIDKDELQTIDPERVRILVEFASSDSIDPSNYARFEVDIAKDDPDVIFENNRHFVEKRTLEQLVKSPGFTWNTINIVKIYVSVFELDEYDEEEILSDNFYVVLDGMRLENVQSQNPLYGLTGYTVIKNENDEGTAEPIVKESNVSNAVEFRFGMDIL